MFLRLPLKLYQMYIKCVSVCNKMCFSMHMLTVDCTHTWCQEGIYYNLLVLSFPQHEQSWNVMIAVLMPPEVMTLAVTYSTKLSSWVPFLSLPTCIAGSIINIRLQLHQQRTLHKQTFKSAWCFSRGATLRL